MNTTKLLTELIEAQNVIYNIKTQISNAPCEFSKSGNFDDIETGTIRERIGYLNDDRAQGDMFDLLDGRHIYTRSLYIRLAK